MNIGHLNKSIIDYRNIVDSGLILVSKLKCMEEDICTM